ncbi:hypothetical protein BS78_K119800 [Paspalum vaginatum]|nr:hypothetical protein BS78_K119800 [Paspalum vaginatum]
MENFSSFFYFMILHYPYIVFFFRISIFLFLVFYRLILPLVLFFSHLLTSSSFFLITLPPEVQSPQALAHLGALNFYLSLYEQDPEWVAFIQHELNHNTPFGDIPVRLKLFLMEERLSNVRRDLICEFISQYERHEAVFPVEPYILEKSLRSYLEHFNYTDNFLILQSAYLELQENGGESVFFDRVVGFNRDFLSEESAKRTRIEIIRQQRWEALSVSKARLERAEFEHALLLFQEEDMKRKIFYDIFGTDTEED